MSLRGEIGFGIEISCIGLVSPHTTYNQHIFVEYSRGVCLDTNAIIVNEIWQCIIQFSLSLLVLIQHHYLMPFDASFS